ncbi:MAG: fatty acid cis/trans isomerase, partial [Bacteroidota bacterium]|nr:fatty acid cis/trans isomerase [Bacteroidota bacterium]
MNREKRVIALLVVILVLIVLLVYSLKPQHEVDFATDVKPILNKHCISCHGGVKKNAGFSVLFESDAMAITNSGKPAIIRGSARNSELIQRLNHSDPELRMPYQKPALSEDEIEILTDWINQGAKWGTHWAYQSVNKTEIPHVNSIFNEKDFIANPIDHFIAAKMEEKNLLPNSPAQKNIIARRLAFDITGLPPEPNLFESFESGLITYEDYLDSLFLDSAYGEKWASWWLDLARYADSKGYETDRGRTIWKYRDWVIKSFNENIPFDQFTIEQLAGDLLPQPTVDQLIATAFHRNTMNNDEGGTDDEEFRVAAVIDRVNTSFDVWQSTTISCVQCHSHPYDPIKHDEYYKLMAFFNNTMDEDLIDESPNLKEYSKADQKEIEEVLEWINLNGDNKTFQIFKKFIQFQEPKYPAHDFSIVDIEKDLGTINGLWLALRNKGEAVLENFDTQGYENLYFMHDSKPGTKLYFRINNKKGDLLAEVDFKPDFKNESDNEIGKDNLNYFDPRLKIKKVKIPKFDEPFDLFIQAMNPSLLDAKEYKNPYDSDAINIIWVTTLPDLPKKGTKQNQIIVKKFMNFLTRVVKNKTPIMVE